jgi:hypothetical protein
MYTAGSYMGRLLVDSFATRRGCDGTVSILIIRHARTCRRRRCSRRWSTSKGRVQHAFLSSGHGALVCLCTLSAGGVGQSGCKVGERRHRLAVAS